MKMRQKNAKFCSRFFEKTHFYIINNGVKPKRRKKCEFAKSRFFKNSYHKGMWDFYIFIDFFLPKQRKC